MSKNMLSSQERQHTSCLCYFFLLRFPFTNLLLICVDTELFPFTLTSTGRGASLKIIVQAKYKISVSSLSEYYVMFL